ncbi:MAG: 4'-phosphopantetheinyl transferase superfamily protein [Cyclobacteriaceae bacterium]|nr:4'-phosphopantetheinyl transferase superfamily protein [Cyclobacteriaceae bacterium]
MPLLLSKPINSHSAYAVWNITETEDQLLDKTHETPPDIISRKKSEWIVSRILIRYLCHQFDLPYEGVENLASGKPILRAGGAEISITHSYPMAAALINLKKPCGIDLEWPRQKFIKVKEKFLHQSELPFEGDIPSLCKIWAAKEVLFKIHGEKNLSLRHEMLIRFTSDHTAEGNILKTGQEETHQLEIEEIARYLLVFSV